MRITIVGSTGLVGKHTLKLLLEDQRVSSVIAPVRRVSLQHPKLVSQVIDFNHLPDDESLWKVDAIVCTLGTTIKEAKSKENFRLVDFEYPVKIAQMGKKYGVKHFILNSAMGANSHSPVFYNKVKGEVEEAIQNIGFERLTILRPGLIGGERSSFRFGEELAKKAVSIFQPVLPKKFWINPAKRIAEKILEVLFLNERGVTIINSEELV